MPPLRHMSSPGVSAYNPSLDLRSMAHRLLHKGQRAVIAIAPSVGDNSANQNASLTELSSPNRREEEAEHGGMIDVVVETETRRVLDGDEGVSVNGRGEKGGAAGGGAELLAAEAFAAWLVEELGGTER